MSATKFAEAGMAAIAAQDWDVAIDNLSKAIDQSKSPAWLLARSQAYMEKKDNARALHDAEYAFCSASERGNDKSRKQMIDAQYRRSVIYFRTKRYADADVCAVWSQQLAKGVPLRSADNTVGKIDANGLYHATDADVKSDGGEGKGKQDAENNSAENSDDNMSRVISLISSGDKPMFPYHKEWEKAQVWRSTIIAFLERLPADDPARKVSVKFVPTKPSIEEKVEEKDLDIEDADVEPAQAAKTQATNPQPASNGPFRSQTYQSDSSITVSLFMKFPSKEDTEKVQVDMQSNLITISGVPREPSTAYIIPHAPIVPAKSTHRVATMKIEFTFIKAQPGKWPNFGREELTKPDPSTLPEANGVDAENNHKSSAPAPTATTANLTSDKPQPKGPAYPTSSKKGPKDWDNLEEYGAQDEDESDVNAFFKNLYKGATPDQQRAMMKSFQESNGTSLSTDWDSVSKGEVETNPPDGVEAKKWAS